jgi:hypothetical protein
MIKFLTPDVITYIIFLIIVQLIQWYGLVDAINNKNEILKNKLFFILLIIPFGYFFAVLLATVFIISLWFFYLVINPIKQCKEIWKQSKWNML